MQDFAAAGHTWTVDLCRKDSDGDGKSNGEELGDPNCTWVAGNTAEGKSTGHPGNVPFCRPNVLTMFLFLQTVNDYHIFTKTSPYE